MSILITPTLLNSFNFLQTAKTRAWKEKAFQDLLGTLRRDKPWEPSKAVEMGIMFENAVYSKCEKIANGEDYSGSELFQYACSRCVGGEFQKKVRYSEKIDDQEYVLYGKLDVFFPKNSPDRPDGEIIDLKTTARFDPLLGRDKYLSGWQHRIYCIGTGVPVFEYLVMEWASPVDFTLVDFHPVEVMHENLDAVRDEVREYIALFVDWCKRNEDTFGTYTALTKTFSRN